MDILETKNKSSCPGSPALGFSRPSAALIMGGFTYQLFLKQQELKDGSDCEAPKGSFKGEAGKIFIESHNHRII